MAALSWDHRWEEPGRLAPARIMALASVIVIHVFVLMALLIPAKWVEPGLTDVPIRIIFLEPLVVPPPPPPPPVIKEVVPPPAVIKPVVPPPQAKPVVTKRAPLPSKRSAAPPVVMETSRPLDLPFEAQPSVEPTVTQSAGPVGVAPQARQDGVVALVSPKPPYPREALLGQIEGTVILRIVVDAVGKPTSVTVEKSSGSRELDRAARETVLRRWRFEGTGAPQTARLPISFNLD